MGLYFFRKVVKVMKRSIQISLWQYGDNLLSKHDVMILQDILDILSNAISQDNIQLRGDLYDTCSYSVWSAKGWDLGLVRTISTANSEGITRDIAKEVYYRLDEVPGSQFTVTNYSEPKK